MPKKAKKGGGVKGGGKTAEKRRLYLQQRAQAEEEMAKKKEEILKDKLQKKERKMAANLLKVNEGWNSILSLTEDPELRHDIMELKQTFERDLDGLDSTIKNLECDLQESGRQAASVRRVHLQHVERLWDQQDKRLVLVQQQWENGMQHISSSLNSERKQMLMHSEQQRADVEDATFTVEHQHNAVMEEIHTLYNQGMSLYESAANMRSAMIMKELVTEETCQNQEAVQECSNEQKNQEYIGQINKDMKTVKSPQEASSEFPELRQVTKSSNTAILQRKALKKHRDDLTQENQQLSLQLSQQMDALKVSDDTFDGRQAPTVTGQPDTNRRHVVKRSPKD